MCTSADELDKQIAETKAAAKAAKAAAKPQWLKDLQAEDAAVIVDEAAVAAADATVAQRKAPPNTSA